MDNVVGGAPIVCKQWRAPPTLLSVSGFPAEMPTVTDSPYLFRFFYPSYGVTVIGIRLRGKKYNYLYCVYMCVCVCVMCVVYCYL